jgi:hypothetical protein
MRSDTARSKKPVELKVGGFGRHGKAHTGKQHRGDQGHAQAGRKAPLEGREQDREEKERKKDAVGPVTNADEYHVPGDISPEGDGCRDDRAVTHRQHQQGGAVDHIEGQHHVNSDDIVGRLRGVNGMDQQR